MPMCFLKKVSFRLGFGALLSVLLLLVLFVCSLCAFGNPSNTLRYLAGQNYVIRPDTVNMGLGPCGEPRLATVTVRNLSFSPIRIVGASTSCRCLIADDMPIEIEAFSQKTVKFTMRVDSPGVSTEQTARLYVDEGGQGKLSQAVVFFVGQCIQR